MQHPAIMDRAITQLHWNAYGFLGRRYVATLQAVRFEIAAWRSMWFDLTGVCSWHELHTAAIFVYILERQPQSNFVKLVVEFR
jgi:hypothetical protein